MKEVTARRVQGRGTDKSLELMRCMAGHPVGVEKELRLALLLDAHVCGRAHTHAHTRRPARRAVARACDSPPERSLPHSSRHPAPGASAMSALLSAELQAELGGDAYGAKCVPIGFSHAPLAHPRAAWRARTPTPPS